MKQQHRYTLAIAITVCSVGACDPVAPETSSTLRQRANLQVQPERARASRRLPAVEAGCTDCSPGWDKPLGICEWANSVDAIVYGVIRNVRFVYSPMVSGDESGVTSPVATCDERIIPALALDLSVERTLWGKVPTELSIWIRYNERTLWQPMPNPDVKNPTAWSSRGEGNILADGSRVGVALHWVKAAQAWALLGEPMFDLEPDGTILFQDRGVCIPPAPPVQGKTLADLASALEQCSGAQTEAGAIRAAKVMRPIERSVEEAARLTSGWCVPKPRELAPGECRAFIDCGPGQQCIDSRCQGDLPPVASDSPLVPTAENATRAQ